MILIAHNIRSLHNVGSIFRSADAFGVEWLYLTGYTATPPRPEIAKVALGSEHRVSWEPRDDLERLIEELKGKGVTVCALDNRSGAMNISKFRHCEEAEGRRRNPDGSGTDGIASSETPRNDKMALILGNEVDGVPAEILARCDGILEIPLPGTKQSLNVSVATGVALFALTAPRR